MSQFTIALLTLISLACHVLFGCCSHHVHSATSVVLVLEAHECGPPRLEAARDHRGHAHVCGTQHAPLRIADEQAQHESEHRDSPEHGDFPCDAPACNYMMADLVKVLDASAVPVVTDAIAATALLATAGRANALDRVDSNACSAGYRDGARLHELMAVWLL